MTTTRHDRPLSRIGIEFLPAREHAHDPTRLRNYVHHSLDCGRALDHPPAATTPAVVMMITMMVVVGRSTIFRRGAVVRGGCSSGGWRHLKEGKVRAASPVCDEVACHARLVPVLLCVVRSRERNRGRGRWLGLLLWRITCGRRCHRGRLLRGERSQDYARMCRVGVFGLPLCTANRAANPFGRWRRW
jgi:hypothetical protein